MGEAAKIMTELGKNREQKYTLDTSTGQITPKVDPAAEAQSQPPPVQAAHEIYD